MAISITFRHLDSSDAIKDYVREKIGRLQRFLRQPMTAKVTLSLDKLRHSAEVRLSSGSERAEASDTSADLYASIDKVVDKLERQIRSTKGTAAAKSKRATVRTDEASSPVASPPATAKKPPARTVTAAKVKAPAKAKPAGKPAAKSPARSAAKSAVARAR
jgi:putative sigma-54 modulation protein